MGSAQNERHDITTTNFITCVLCSNHHKIKRQTNWTDFETCL